MSDLENDSLRAQLRAGDPYRGEPMPTLDAARVKARMRAAVAGVHVRLRWIPAAAAAAMATVAGLGVWVISRPSIPEQTLAAPSPATAGVTGVSESPDETVSRPKTRLAGPTTQLDPADALAALAHPELAEAGPVAVAPPELAVAADQPPRTEARRIRFAAPRGTKIVWTLDPDFEPRTTHDAPLSRHQQGANDQW
jgi:hypothetical protein